MSFLSAVTDVLRPPAAREAKTDTGVSASPEPSARERQAMLHLSNVSHAVNHFQNQMMTMLYPSIMADLGDDLHGRGCPLGHLFDAQQHLPGCLWVLNAVFLPL